MEPTHPIQSLEEQTLHPHLVLQKLIKFLRKHNTFDFVDPIRSVQFRVQPPALASDYSLNEHLLRNFWRHCQNLYFRVPSQSELARLEYFSNILFSQNSNELPFRPNQHFWRNLEGVFNPNYLQKQFQVHDKNMDVENWLCTLNLYNHLLQNQEGRPNKQIQKQLNKLVTLRKAIQPISNKTRFQTSLLIQNKQLKKLLPPLDEKSDEVSEQIKQFQNQLNDNHQETAILFNELMCRISHEEQSKRMIYCFGDSEYDIQMEEPQDEEIILYNKISSIENQLKYLEYKINRLEKRQIAESISKIIRFQKSRGGNKFFVVFEEAMNVNKKYLTERQLIEFNALREYSLFQYYTTALKTPYTYICQNSFGFKQVYLYRNKECKYTNSNLLEEMKKIAHDPYSEYQQVFQNFDICHHCKLLYPPNYLVKCKYSSEKAGAPSTPTPYYDSYISQISKISTSKPQRFQVKKRSCFFNYTKVKDLFFCNRKFCHYCVQQNYEEAFDKNGHCPFCQGICFCTRCQREDLIVRLKSIFNLLGGDINKLVGDTFLEFQDQENDLEANKYSSRKGRPKKVTKRSVSASFDEADKKAILRVQMQPLRLLGDLVKKRQKKKMMYFKNQQELFQAKMNSIDRNLNLLNVNQANLSMENEAQIRKGEKVHKKRNRMI